MPDKVDNYLAHFGVKGMRWGIRKSPYRSTESNALLSESDTSVKTFGANVIEKLYANVLMTKSEYENLSRETETLNAGEIIRRTTRTPDLKLSGRTFVSKLDEDSEIYRAIIPGNTSGGKTDYGKVYELEGKANRSLTGPSERERVDTFMELMDRPAVRESQLSPPITGREYLAQKGLNVKDLSSEEITLKNYRRFVTANYRQDEPLVNAYFDTLKSKGFGFVADDDNRGRIAKQPLILLNPEQDISVSSVRRLTADEINQAQRKLKLIHADRKDFTMKTEDYLAHFGVMGMRWGRRKASNDGTPQPVTVGAKPGKKVVAKGGENLPASEDAKQTAKYKQAAKASSTDALSNTELKVLVERLNLEQQYSKLTATQVSPGRKFVSEIISQQGKQAANKFVGEQMNDFIKKQQGK